jgi:hypothetical protein
MIISAIRSRGLTNEDVARRSGVELEHLELLASADRCLFDDVQKLGRCLNLSLPGECKKSKKEPDESREHLRIRPSLAVFSFSLFLIRVPHCLPYRLRSLRYFQGIECNHDTVAKLLCAGCSICISTKIRKGEKTIPK